MKKTREKRYLVKKTGVLAFAVIFGAGVILSGCGKKKEEPVSDNTLKPLTELKTSPADEGQVAVAETNTVGPMAVYPADDDYMGALAGSNSITLYFQSRGVVSGIGKIGLYNASTGAIFATADVSFPEVCAVSPIDEQGVELTGWTDGTMAQINFDTAFVAGQRYYILLDPGCFMLGDVTSKAVTNASLLKFVVKPYGLNGTLNKHYEVGELVDVPVMVGGECKQVRISQYDPNFISIPSDYVTETGSIPITFIRDGIASFKIDFLDDTNEIDSVTVNVAVGNADPSLLDSIDNNSSYDTAYETETSVTENGFVDVEQPGGSGDNTVTTVIPTDPASSSDVWAD